MERESPVQMVRGIVLGVMQQYRKREILNYRGDGFNWRVGTTTVVVGGVVVEMSGFLSTVFYTCCSSLCEISGRIEMAFLLELSSLFQEIIIHLKSFQLCIQAGKSALVHLGI